MVAELPECGEGVGLVRLSLDAPELLLISFLPLELVDHLLHEQRVERDRLPGA